MEGYCYWLVPLLMGAWLIDCNLLLNIFQSHVWNGMTNNLPLDLLYSYRLNLALGFTG